MAREEKQQTTPLCLNTVRQEKGINKQTNQQSRCVLTQFFFLRLPIGQYGPVSQLSRSEESCTGPFNWGEAHCAGEKVKRKIGPFQWKSL